MTTEQFMQDLQTIYDELQRRQGELNNFYKLTETEHDEASLVVNRFLETLSLQSTDESIMAALTRIVNLREDALEQVLQQQGLREEDIIAKKEKAYLFVSDFYLRRFEMFIKWVESEKLLTPFYRAIVSGVHNVGVAMSGWQSAWTSHIIHGINRELFTLFNGDEEKIFEKLLSDNLLDRDEDGEIGDRCYSVLHLHEDGYYHSISYAEAFKEEVAGIQTALRDFIKIVSQTEDDVFGQKEAWIKYLLALNVAFSHTRPDELIGYWAEVDRAWMEVRTPLQIGHPLEYYEDHYRKAVALEWDLRITNPKLQLSSHTRENIKGFASQMAEGFGGDAQRIISKNLAQVDDTQLYIGQPMLYYGAEFNGLFSAQVVPNDERVSAEFGKKIFAYADFVLEGKKSKPVMKLSLEFMGKEFIQKQRTLMQHEEELWHQIYDISTIGHEFGHILWIDNDTEMKMNTSGQFKNIEEFKATTGGLLAFFHNETESLKTYLVDDLVSRAVGLMAWREVGEVLPYYCEGLIHLDILFKSGVLSYEKKVQVDYDRYEAMKERYVEAYTLLAEHYLAKEDAALYLNRYARKEEHIYLPVDERISAFVEYYYKRYKEIGQQTVVLD